MATGKKLYIRKGVNGRKMYFKNLIHNHLKLESPHQRDKYAPLPVPQKDVVFHVYLK